METSGDLFIFFPDMSFNRISITQDILRTSMNYPAADADGVSKIQPHKANFAAERRGTNPVEIRNDRCKVIENNG
jgi:hypothetical protein